MLKFKMRSGYDSAWFWQVLNVGEVRANQTLRVVTILPCIIIYVFPMMVMMMMIIIIRKAI